MTFAALISILISFARRTNQAFTKLPVSLLTFGRRLKLCTQPSDAQFGTPFWWSCKATFSHCLLPAGRTTCMMFSSKSVSPLVPITCDCLSATFWLTQSIVGARSPNSNDIVGFIYDFFVQIYAHKWKRPGGSGALHGKPNHCTLACPTRCTGATGIGQDLGKESDPRWM